MQTVRQRLHALFDDSNVYMFFRTKGNCNYLVEEAKKIISCDEELYSFLDQDDCRDCDVRYNSAFNDELATWPDLAVSTYDDQDTKVLSRLEKLEKDVLLAATHDICYLNEGDYSEEWVRLQTQWPELFGQLYPHMDLI